MMPTWASSMQTAARRGSGHARGPRKARPSRVTSPPTHALISLHVSLTVQTHSRHTVRPYGIMVWCTFLCTYYFPFARSWILRHARVRFVAAGARGQLATWQGGTVYVREERFTEETRSRTQETESWKTTSKLHLPFSEMETARHAVIAESASHRVGRDRTGTRTRAPRDGRVLHSRARGLHLFLQL